MDYWRDTVGLVEATHCIPFGDARFHDAEQSLRVSGGAFLGSPLQ